MWAVARRGSRIMEAVSATDPSKASKSLGSTNLLARHGRVSLRLRNDSQVRPVRAAADGGAGQP